MSLKHYELAESVLGLRSNTAKLKWSYGITPPEATASAFENCIVRLGFEVSDRLFTKPMSGAGKYHYFSGHNEGDSLRYTRPLLGRRRLDLEVDGLVSGSIRLRVNSAYFRYVKHRFMNLHSPGYLLTDIASLALLRHRLAPIHCSAFCIGSKTVLILAPPNTGKTLTTMRACLDHGADFMAEDLAITDGRNLFGVPWTSTFRYYEDVDSRPWAKCVNLATSKIPALELLNLVGARPISDYLRGRSQLVAQRPVTHIVILQRGMEPMVQEESPDSALRKALNLNRYEFNYRKSPLLVAYEYFNPALDLDGAARTEMDLLRELVNSSRAIWSISSSNALDYTPLLLERLGVSDVVSSAHRARAKSHAA